MTHLVNIRPPVGFTGNLLKCSSKRLSAPCFSVCVLSGVDPTHAWKTIPISRRNDCAFFPLMDFSVMALSLSKNPQQAWHGSVDIRAKDNSSSFGLKSLVFCFFNVLASHTITAKFTVRSARRFPTLTKLAHTVDRFLYQCVGFAFDTSRSTGVGQRVLLSHCDRA
jgi:hypothetical protein